MLLVCFFGTRGGGRSTEAEGICGRESRRATVPPDVGMYLLCWNSPARRARLTDSLPEREPRSLKCEARHDAGDNRVWLSCAGAEYAGRRQHSKIAENVVARAYPGREHVGIVGRFLRLQHRINNTDGRRKIHIQISRVIPC